MFHFILLLTEYILALAVFIILFFIPAPYGRFGHGIRRFRLPARYGWFLMELPALVTLPLFYLTGRGWEQPAIATVWLVFWLLHYGQRDLIYPFLLPHQASPMPIPVMLGGMVYNILNGYIMGWELFHLDRGLDRIDFRLIIGIGLFLTGMIINLHSDHILRQLKKETGGGYAVPQRGWHRLVASPNYFGELVEWSGWALMTFSAGGLAFALFTFANLAPRAWKQRIWYRNTFGENYPLQRRAILPFLF